MWNNIKENSFFYDFYAQDEVDTKHAAAFPMKSVNNICNSIVRIKIRKKEGNNLGTGFFMKTNIKGNNIPFLYTNYHIIEQEDLNDKKTFYIYYGPKDKEKKVSIKLDRNKRIIKLFKKPVDVTLIEILQIDNIPEDKYLFLDDSYLKDGFESYVDKNFYLAGYPNNEINAGDIFLCSGKILGINGFEFNHDLDTRKGSSGSPVCLIENNKVIGIHKNGDQNLNMNYGVFLGYILESLENENVNIEINNNNNKNNNDINNNNINNNNINNNNINSNNINIDSNYINIDNINIINNNNNDNYCFFTFREYKEDYLKFHKMIANHYVNQSEYNFNKNYKQLCNYLHFYNFKLEKKTKDEFLKSLIDFKDIYAKSIFEKIVFKSDFINDINELLLSKNSELLKRLSYFIGGYMLALNKCGNTLDCEYKQNTELYQRRKMGYKELMKLQENINQIICFKTFLCDIAPSGHIHGEIYRGFINGKTFLHNFYLNLVDKNIMYDCKITINHIFQDNWKTNCFSVFSKDIISFPQKIFNLFSFFRVKEVKIDQNDKSAQIVLDTIGKKEILEYKIWNKHTVEYNNNENIIEAIPPRN